MSDVPPPTHKWTWRLAALGTLIVVLAAAGRFWQLISNARHRRMAVASLRHAGGEAWYDFQLTASGEPLPDATPPGRDALSRFVGEDLFYSTHTVSLSGPQFNDGHLKQVQQLPQLQILRLQGANVTDSGLKCLAGLSELRRLYLGNTSVTDAGMVSLSGLTNLTDLWLHNTPITDAGLAKLEPLSKLEVLVLFETRVTEAGVHRLQRALPHCEIVVQ